MKIAFFRPSSYLDKAITFFTRGKYSHVCIILNDGSVIEARPFYGVRYLKSIYDGMNKKDVVDIYEVDTTEEQDKIITDFLYNQIGKGYDYWSVFGFVIYTKKESRESRGKWFCSELVFSAFYKATIHLFERIEAWMISPSFLSYSTDITFSNTITK